MQVALESSFTFAIMQASLTPTVSLSTRLNTATPLEKVCSV